MAYYNGDFTESETSGAAFSQEEIEKAYCEEFGTDEFWIDEMNTDMLQCIVDTKFSVNPGYEYEVDCQLFSTPRLVVYCLEALCMTCPQLCHNVELKSYHHFMGHHKGKAHCKKSASYLYTVPPQETEEDAPTLKLRPLNKGKKFPLGSLEYEISNYKSPIVGVGVAFVYKEMISQNMVYSCDLCKLQHVSQQDMLSHLASFRHTQKYANVIWQEYPATKTEMAKLRAIIEEREGRIHHSISNLSHQLPMSVRFGPTDLTTSSLSLTNICTSEICSTSERAANESCNNIDYQDKDHTTGHKLSEADSKIIIKDLKKHSIRLKNFYAKKKDTRDIAKRMDRVSKLLNNLKVD